MNKPPIPPAIVKPAKVTQSQEDEQDEDLSFEERELESLEAIAADTEIMSAQLIQLNTNIKEFISLVKGLVTSYLPPTSPNMPA